MHNIDDANKCKVYLPINVLKAAEERISWIFDNFKFISVSVSGGKDSTVLFELTHREAVKRSRKISVFFLDQEAEYQSSIVIIRKMMARKLVIPNWYQVPCYMTNSTAYKDDMLYAWDPKKEGHWLREKEDISIKNIIDGVNRFYPLMEYVDSNMPENSCSLVGLRSEESLNRFGAVTRNPAIKDINWSSKTAGKCVKLYPIYDWTFEDVWTFIGNEKLEYNKVYDWLWVKGRNLTEMRVSNLIHEKSFRCLADLQEFEPETYNKLIKRIGGVHVAARYARGSFVYNARKLPSFFKTWKEYRDFLLETYPGSKEKLEKFKERFASQNETQATIKQQVKQLLINDWENNIPIVQQPEKEDPLKKWMDVL